MCLDDSGLRHPLHSDSEVIAIAGASSDEEEQLATATVFPWPSGLPSPSLIRSPNPANNLPHYGFSSLATSDLLLLTVRPATTNQSLPSKLQTVPDVSRLRTISLRNRLLHSPSHSDQTSSCYVARQQQLQLMSLTSIPRTIPCTANTSSETRLLTFTHQATNHPCTSNR